MLFTALINSSEVNGNPVEVEIIVELEVEKLVKLLLTLLVLVLTITLFELLVDFFPPST